ncbi:hypothetical protein FHG87_003293 [Trinorchestia longiramus]|nr:hypothetical protein FHG87_003293 [Trinorchestia longiramus]
MEEWMICPHMVMVDVVLYVLLHSATNGRMDLSQAELCEHVINNACNPSSLLRAIRNCCSYANKKSLSLPSIPLPSIPLTSIPLPSIPFPYLGIPSIHLLSIPLPSIPLPSILLPFIHLPSIPIPFIHLPSNPLPSIPLPSTFHPVTCDCSNCSNCSCYTNSLPAAVRGPDDSLVLIKTIWFDSFVSRLDD